MLPNPGSFLCLSFLNSTQHLTPLAAPELVKHLCLLLGRTFPPDLSVLLPSLHHPSPLCCSILNVASIPDCSHLIHSGISHQFYPHWCGLKPLALLSLHFCLPKTLPPLLLNCYHSFPTGLISYDAFRTHLDTKAKVTLCKPQLYHLNHWNVSLC